MRKLILLLIVGMFLISFTSAYDPHENGTDLEYSFSDTIATTCNVSTMNYPGGAITIGQTMGKVGSTFNTTILAGNFTTLGSYCFNIECDDGYGSFCREVTKTGTTLGIQESIIYVVLAFGVFLLFILSFYFSLTVPYSNEINERGAVIKISKLKYVKLGFIMLTWAFLTWFFNILVGLADNFVSLTMYYGFFGFIFDVMTRLAFPFGIVILVIALFEIIRDSNIHKNISKFGSS